MITLATLKDATAQEVFDQVANHLMTQMKRSEASGGCAYRAGSLKCAAGCLIGDDEYDPRMDGTGGLNWNACVKKHLFPDTNHSKLITELQDIHDLHDVIGWKSSLIGLATHWELSIQNVKGLL